MLIRRIQTADAMAVKRLRLQALTQEPLAFAMDVTQAADWADAQWVQIASRNSDGVPTIVLAQVGTELVGMVGCHIDASPKRAHCGMVWGMYVAPQQRGRGVGRRLLAAVKEHGIGQAYTMLKLSVTNYSAAAQTLYSEEGFTVYGHEPALLCIDGITYDAYHMMYTYPRK
jgi:ribosomal protein S18 acetylase RimI-like enzyme